MQIDLPYADLSASQNVEELRVQLNDYLYRLREAIEIAIEMELTSQTVVSDSVTRLELRQLSDQILADANSVLRSSLETMEKRINEKIENYRKDMPTGLTIGINYETGMLTYELLKGE